MAASARTAPMALSSLRAAAAPGTCPMTLAASVGRVIHNVFIALPHLYPALSLFSRFAVVVCPIVPFLANGQLLSSDNSGSQCSGSYVFGDSCNIKCNTGYGLDKTDPTSITCSRSGSWSALPSCKGVIGRSSLPSTFSVIKGKPRLTLSSSSALPVSSSSCEWLHCRTL